MSMIRNLVHQSRAMAVAALMGAAVLPVAVYADAAQPAAVKAAPVQAAAATAAKPAVPVAGQVNINTADAQTLADQLNGVGLKKAQAIVAYREQHGAFKTADELVNVPGIGNATLEKNRNVIVVN